MKWYTEYLGKPYVFRSRSKDAFDCYGLVMLAYKKVLNEVPPDYLHLLGNHRSIQPLEFNLCFESTETKSYWAVVEDPKPMDLVIVSKYGFPVHCGILIDNMNILHTTERLSCCVARTDSVYWKNRIDKYLRPRV